MMHKSAILIATGALFFYPPFAYAQGIITLESADDELKVITDSTPLADEFSPLKAAQYLDETSLTWQKVKKCATCHTNMPYLFARPALSDALPDSGEVRKFFEEYRTVRWAKRKPKENQGFYPVVLGAALTFNDLQTGGELGDVTREILDLMWEVQREDGSWRWPHCDYAPMEIDDHFGVTLAALTVGIAPSSYSETERATQGIAKIREYFGENPPKSLHHRAMLAWSSLRLEGIATAEERAATLKELLDAQLQDGGWSTSSFLTDWHDLPRRDSHPWHTQVSDAYGTALVIIIARETGVPANDERLQRGIQWLLSNQRENGMWFTRSPVNDAGNLISNTGTAYAILALQSCGELPGWPLHPVTP